MNVLDLLKCNDDYNVDTVLDVRHNGNWIGTDTVEHILYQYGLCEVVAFNRRYIDMIGRRNEYEDLNN